MKLDAEARERLARVHRQVRRNEQYWIARLSRLKDPQLPYCAAARGREAGRESVPVPLPEAADRRLVTAAFAAYLARLCDTDRYHLAYSSAALREDLAGFEESFATHVPVEVRIDPAAAAAGQLRAVSECFAAAAECSTYAHDLFLRESQLPRERRGRAGVALAVCVEERDGAAGPTQPLASPLTLVVAPDASECRLAYDTACYSEENVLRMRDQFRVFLDSVTRDPHRPLVDHPLMDEAERRRILVDWNRTQADLPDGLCMHQLFERQVERVPDKVALVCGDQRLSFRELNARANQLAHWLRQAGVEPETRVGLCLERSPQLLVALLGIAKAGGAYVPLDPAYPSEHLAYVLEDSGASLLITQEGLSSQLPAHELRVLWVDRDRDEIAALPRENPQPLSGPEHLAYVLYTSGSTGRPKGVMIEHGSLVNFLTAMGREPGLAEDDVLLSVTTISFDIAGLELYLPLVTGAQIVLASTELGRDGTGLAQLLAASGATVMQATPSTWRMLLDTAWEDGSLRMLCGGEPLSAELAGRLLQRGGRLWNLYGPTEATVWATSAEVVSADRDPAIGRPIANTRLYILDSRMQPVPVGVPGLLYIGGVQVARGYLNRHELTQRKFVADPFSQEAGARLYETGDLARFLPDGSVECLGRVDNQVKVRGFRVEPGEIEFALAAHPRVAECAVAGREDQAGHRRLVAYIVPARGGMPTAGDLRRFLGERLPDHMIPSVFVGLDALPLSPNGKIDRRALPAPGRFRPQLDASYEMPEGETEEWIASVWREALQIDEVGALDNFFELGGDSMLLASIGVRLSQHLGRELSMVELFRYPTVRALADHLGRGAPEAEAASPPPEPAAPPARDQREDVAVIGMACRFPGAENVEEFWRNLEQGVESITFCDDDELREAGVPSALLKDPGYVKAGSILSDVEGFDADFFGYSLREAEMMDPQHRLFLENAWEALESAGYAPGTLRGAVGLYAGASMNHYVLENLRGGFRDLGAIQRFQIMTGNDKDYLPTRVSYKLDLRGPSLNIQSACSTSLVAIHMACRSLLSGECDVALAGGVSVAVPQKAGYLYQEGMIASPDGHCRSFDARAGGTIFGSGVGVVVLKRLAQARADGDTIHAVVRGSAINNDGSLKAGYTAPSVDGQADVIAKAQRAAGAHPETIGYVEAHGTATAIGDPIEVAALTQAFRAGTEKRSFCGIGTVKSNFGHLDAAAGVAGFIKTVLALEHGRLPPSLNFEEPNPEIDFAQSPFYVVTEASPWKGAADGGAPRRAGVSSFGIGGTNCHVVLEEPPACEPEPPATERPRQLLTLSGRSPAALSESARRYEACLAAWPQAPLGDVCFTANAGRVHFEHRLAVVAQSGDELRRRLAAAASGREAAGVLRGRAAGRRPRVAFLFTGQGAQYCGMGRELYETQPTFRRELDRCAEIAAPYLERPLLEVLYPRDPASSPLDQTAYTQPALFALEVSLAGLWRSWGIQPSAVLGHSVGEYAAACVAGVFSLEAGLALCAERGRLMQSLPRDGEMFAIAADESRVMEAIEPYRDEVSIASVNGPDHVVISGRRQALRAAVASLEAQELKVQRLKVSHAFHSPSMDPILDAFGEAVAGVDLSTPEINLISNLSGQPAGAEVTTPEYWCRHIRQPVRFADGMASLARQGIEVFVEIGSKPTLLGMARQCEPGPGRAWLPSLREGYGEWQQMLESLGELYVRGAPVDWAGFDADYPRRRVPLPTYPFQRQRCWMEPDPVRGQRRSQRSSTPELPEPASVPRGAPAAAEVDADDTLLRGLQAAAAAERLPLLLGHVQAEVARVLGLDAENDAVDPQQPFTEMGLDSLLSIELRSRLEKSLGVSFPPAFALHSSAAELSALLLELMAGEEGPLLDWTPVVPLQESGSQPPFFFLSGSRNHFGDSLGPDQPVYRVLYQDLEREQPFVTIEEMAAFGLAAIRSVQVEGPYCLGGHGLGGVVAFEIAQQLRRQGQFVAALVLCESRAPGSGRSPGGAGRLRRLGQRARHYAGRSRRVGPRRQLAELLRGIRRSAQRATSAIQKGAGTRSRQGYRAAADEAQARYQPQPYPGRITVVRCADHPPWGYEDPQNGWADVAEGGVETHEVPGSHTSIYREPNVQRLASTLRDVLARARAREDG